MADTHDEIERTEAPSPRRLAQAREQGYWPRSPELVAACVVLAGIVAIRIAGGNLAHSLLNLARDGLTVTEITTSPSETLLGWRSDIGHTLLAVFPILLVPVIVAVVAGVAQVGLQLRPESLVADPARLNVLTGLQRIFSAEAVGSALVAAAKWTAVLALSFWWLWLELSHASQAGQDSEQFVQQTTGILVRTGTKVAAVLVMLGLLDYARAWWSWRRQVQVSRAQLQSELREAEGDPLLRRRRRQQQLERSQHRAGPVLTARDLVFVGRGRVAIATRESAHGHRTVSAKAIGPAADRLVRAARSRGAKIVRDPDTARALYRQSSTGQAPR